MRIYRSVGRETGGGQALRRKPYGVEGTDKAGHCDPVRLAPSKGVELMRGPRSDNAVYPSRVVPAVIVVIDRATSA